MVTSTLGVKRHEVQMRKCLQTSFHHPSFLRTHAGFCNSTQEQLYPAPAQLSMHVDFCSARQVVFYNDIQKNNNKMLVFRTAAVFISQSKNNSCASKTGARSYSAATWRRVRPKVRGKCSRKMIITALASSVILHSKSFANRKHDVKLLTCRLHDETRAWIVDEEISSAL